MELTKCKLGELITQRREKNDGSDLPICGVSKDGLIPPKQVDADTSIYNVFYRDDFEENLDMLEKANLGTVIRKLKELDYSDGHPDLSKQDYALLEQIREIRNYWCHQCFLDYVYIQDDYQRERKFQQVAQRLSEDENRTWDLHEHLQQLRNKMLRRYHRV